MNDIGESEHEGGESLVELLMAVAILGVMIVAIIEVLFTMVGSSTLLGEQVRGQNALSVWGEAVTNSAYTACATPANVLAAAPAIVPSGFTPQVSSVTYWNGSSFGSACTPATDQGLQLITLSATAPAGPLPTTPQTLTVIKRKPCESGC